MAVEVAIRSDRSGGRVNSGMKIQCHLYAGLTHAYYFRLICRAYAGGIAGCRGRFGRINEEYRIGLL